MKSLFGYIAVILAASCFGLFAIFGSNLASFGLEPINVLCIRFFGATIILFFIALFTKQLKTVFKVNAKQLIYLLLIAVFFYGGTSLLLLLSYCYIPTGIATTVHFAYPIVVFVFCIILKQEKLNIRNGFGLLLAIIGIIFVSNLDLNGNISFLGLLLALISSFTFAFYMILVKNKVFGNLNLFTLVFWVNSFSGLFYLIISFIFLPDFASLSNISGIIFNGLGLILFTTITASFALTWGIRKIGSANAAILCCLEPITATTMGILFLNEIISSTFLIGALFIFTSTVLIATQNDKKKEIKA